LCAALDDGEAAARIREGAEKAERIMAKRAGEIGIKVAPPESGAKMVVGKLHRLADRIEDLSCRISETLRPVCLCESLGKNQGPEPAFNLPEVAPVFEDLSAVAERLEDAMDRIESILGRVDL